jgi:tRNA pseudouridine32 synthase/23S rRNA pseudouridine746 synthase
MTHTSGGATAHILYQDEDLLAVSKPEGVVSVATADSEGLPGLLREVYAGRLFPVHRLDKGASGVLLFAKNAAAHRLLNREFERKAVKKTYLVLVRGLIAKNRGIINAPVREFGSGRMGVDPTRGKAAQTAFKVVEKLKAFTLVRAFPATGRRHQIRVHFYCLGHPVAGDRRYGQRSEQSEVPRLMLHAESLEFDLPSGRRLTVSDPAPESFNTVLENLRKQDARR